MVNYFSNFNNSITVFHEFWNNNTFYIFIVIFSDFMLLILFNLVYDHFLKDF